MLNLLGMVPGKKQAHLGEDIIKGSPFHSSPPACFPVPGGSDFLPMLSAQQLPQCLHLSSGDVTCPPCGIALSLCPKALASLPAGLLLLVTETIVFLLMLLQGVASLGKLFKGDKCRAWVMQ